MPDLEPTFELLDDLPADQLGRHLVERHGHPADVVRAHEPDEHAVWHPADHRTRIIRDHQGRVRRRFLDHEHPSTAPKPKTASTPKPR